MNAKEYFRDIILPLHQRHEADPRALDLLFATCVMTYHIVDYIAADNTVSVRDAQSEIETSCPTFTAICGIATAMKHSTVTRSPEYTGLSSDAASKRSAIKVGGKLVTFGGKLAMLGPVVRKVDGKFFSLAPALQSTISYLRDRFGQADQPQDGVGTV